MPGQLSQRGAELALDATSGRAAVAARTMYLALVSVAPVDADTPASITELAATGYARLAAGWTVPTTSDPSGDQLTGPLTFGPFTTDPASAVGCVLISSSSGATGEITRIWTFDTPKDAGVGESITIAANALTMSVD